ncbi:ubiquitin carboxyl-terminal hydrolase MINDY [Plasmodium brasilianum]|uniref:MINDY deubiquitinase domain-containing protein n=2 Tax=Plasmodium (Plasmodium) TaxID=418103 RepID=A0A1D3TEG8_PLAMA|nr:conserved protein, unknown function [Plasmodium malariae]KAI4834747.1 ubiquitin carboxyl-terminal hydrolase MINDY [Plasmodium brasilianum]SCP03304.1 conserved protein, unknown function [Plasmodium malariae]
MSSLIKLHYDENNDEEENLIIRFADYETFKSYVLKKYDKIYEVTDYEKENINYYSIKWINFINRKVPILLQNKNGPCPLLCITNILLLRNQLQLDRKIKKISHSFLEGKIMDILLESNKKNVTNHDSSCNYRKNIIECVDILPQLKYGLDINCKFTNIHSFEYTKGFCIFDMLNIPLYHGWVISSDDIIFYSYLKDYSYNVIINKIIRYNEYYEKNKTRYADESSNSEQKTFYQIEDVKVLCEEKNRNDTEKMDVDQHNIPVFPDDLDKNGRSNRNKKLYKEDNDIVNGTWSDNEYNDDTTKKKNNIPLSNKNSDDEGNNNRKRRTHIANSNSGKNSNHLNLDKNTNKSDVEIKDDNLPNFSNKENKYTNNSLFHSNKNNTCKNNKKDYSDNNLLNTPKFPEDDFISGSSCNNSRTTNQSCDKNVQVDGDTMKEKNINEKELRINNELFTELNKKPSQASDINGDNNTDNNTENYIMNNYNTEINLTPYEIHEALIISEFLETYKTQLTLVGLKLLKENLNPNQLVAFFRNNHFNTLFKYDNKLFLLAADISFLHLSCTWELFDNVDNDTSYYDNNFRCLSSQKNLEKNLNHSMVYLKNYEKGIAKNNMHCVRSNTTLSNTKKKKKKCTFM